MKTEKKKALLVSTIISFLTAFEISDITILQKLGYEVHCACNSIETEGRNNKEKLRALGVIVHHVPFTRFPISKSNVAAYKELKRIMQSERFDLVHCHTPVGGVIGRIVACKYRRYGTKVIYTAHGFHFYKGAPIKNWLIFYPIEKYLSRYTDVLITINTEDYKRALEKFYAKKVFHIPGVGVDTLKFLECKVDKSAKRAEIGVNEKDFLLLSVGELSERKNQVIVIKALAKLKEAGALRNIVYLVVGDGYKRDEFEALIDEKDLGSCVRLLGYRSDISELCKIVDCFVHPSIREGLGIAPLEAMAAGLPLIYADVNGIKDYTTNGRNGVGVNPHSISQIQAAIEMMYKNDKFRRRCVEYNVVRVKEYDINIVREKMKVIYCGINT